MGRKKICIEKIIDGRLRVVSRLWFDLNKFIKR